MAMFTDECRQFLMELPHTAKIATVLADGRPHVAPVWFVLDGDMLIFTTGHTTVKALNMQRDPRVYLCVDDETPPFSYAQIEGIATISAELEPLHYWAKQIGGRYMGEERAEEYGKRNGVPGELLVRVTPTKIYYEKDITD